MRLHIGTTAVMLLATGCGNADSRTFDSSDPVHCMVVFGIAANSARAIGQPGIAAEMTHRLTDLAERNGGADWIARITPQAQEIGRKLEAARDERATIRLLQDCEAAQDADPAFRDRLTRR